MQKSGASQRLASRERWSVRRCPLASTSRCILICSGTHVASRWRTKDAIPVVYKPTWGIGTSSTRCGTRSCRPIDSKAGGKTKLVANNDLGFGPWATVSINSIHSSHDYSGT